MHLGSGRKRLLHLRMETAVVDSISRRARNDGHVVHRTECIGDVPGLHRGNLRSLVVDEAGLLKFRKKKNRKQVALLPVLDLRVCLRTTSSRWESRSPVCPEIH